MVKLSLSLSPSPSLHGLVGLAGFVPGTRGLVW